LTAALHVEPVVRIQREDFDAAAEVRAMTQGRHDIGAVVTFTGLCRDEGGRLAALELEHYPGMAEAEIARICAEAAVRWPLQAVTAIHRFGRIMPGAAGFVMDFLKSSAPFWKKEHDRQGSAGSWVAAKDSDETALERWRR
jgi:molybdopterin synthase catalytic subunit